jgi:hypothetical protein
MTVRGERGDEEEEGRREDRLQKTRKKRVIGDRLWVIGRNSGLEPLEPVRVIVPH